MLDYASQFFLDNIKLNTNKSNNDVIITDSKIVPRVLQYDTTKLRNLERIVKREPWERVGPNIGSDPTFKEKVDSMCERADLRVSTDQMQYHSINSNS